MTKAQIAQKLRLLQDSMIEIADAMASHGASDPLMKLHSEELHGAAELAGEWADEIGREEAGHE